MRKEECFVCGSADNVVVYDDWESEGDTWFCHTPNCSNKKAEAQLSTHKFKFYDDALRANNKMAKEEKKISPEFITQAHAAYDSGKVITQTLRGIKPEIWNKYGYKESAKVPGRVMVPSTTERGDIVGYKWRNLVKGEGQNFGWLAIQEDLHQVVGMSHASSSYKVYVFEGGEDSLAAAQMLGKYSFVWVPNGAASALKSIDASINFLDKFDEVVICMDDDEAGRTATKQILDKYPEFKRLNLPQGCKDANECLQKGKTKEFQECAWAASAQEPDFVVSWDDIIHNIKNKGVMSKGIRTGLDATDKLLGGWRAGEVTVLTASTGAGKSTLARQLAYAQVVFGNNVVVVSSEETCEAWVEKMSRLHTGERNLANIAETAEFLRGRVTFINPDRFESSPEGVKKLFKATELQARAKGATLTIIDNITHIAQAASTEYYKLINQLAPETVTMARRANTSYLVIGHETKKVGDEPSLADTNGGAALNNFSQNVIAYKRTKDKGEGQETNLYLLKRREEFEGMPSVGSEEAKQPLVYDWSINGFTCENYSKEKQKEKRDAIPDVPVRLDNAPVVVPPTVEVQQPVEEKKEPEPLKKTNGFRPNKNIKTELRLSTRTTGVRELPQKPPETPTPDTKPEQTVHNKRQHPCKPQPRYKIPEKKRRTYSPRMQERWKLDRESKLECKQVFADIKSSKAPKCWGVPNLSSLDTTITATGKVIPCFSDWQIDFRGVADIANDEAQLSR